MEHGSNEKSLPHYLGFDQLPIMASGAPAAVLIQSLGYAYRIKANILKREHKPGGILQRLLLNFTQALLLQTEQSAVDHRQTIINQLCRFLLMTQDRSSGGSYPMTYELAGQQSGTNVRFQPI